MKTRRPSHLSGRGRLTAFGVVTFVLCGLLPACHRSATPFRSAMDQAEEARRQGQYSEERQHFDEAATLAKKPDDASEARYRSAQSWVREGQLETGAQELEALAKKDPTSARAARAWFDSGRAWERANAPGKALSAYREVVSRYPESGNALSAAQRLVSLEGALRHRPAHEGWRELLDKNCSAEFDEALRYHYARALEEVSIAKALLAYEDVAQKHPLPRASYSDEALYRAAELRRQMGDASGALETLEVLLSQGGVAALVGSYTRTAYIEALLLKGLILRDDLQLPQKADETFQSLPEKYPKSRLVDDALWESIRTKETLGADPCPGFQELRKHRPESRYLRCESFLCGGKTNDRHHEARCKDWLKIPLADVSTTEHRDR